MAEKADKKYDKAPPPAIENPERDALYAQYTQLQGEEQPEAAAEQVVGEQVPAEEQAEEQAEYVAEKTEDKQDNEEKTVPYGALKEEREKRKKLSTKVDELQEQIKQLIDDNRKLMETFKPPEKKEPPEEEPEIADYDSEIIALRKKVRQLETTLQSTSTTVQTDIQARKNQDLEARAKRVDAELEKDGFPGFYDLIPQVINKLHELKDPRLFTEEGWAKVFKEHVYPNVIGKRIPKKEDPPPPPDKKQEKVSLKKDLKMVTSPGRPPESPKGEDEKDWSYDSYLKMRNSHSVFQ